ncbi:hypothetical protein BJF90_00840 [Pseudonocardia sp. CNS-004]|nr:hypothetical protein BJF90_00840 [Pseudonocardia sp. CNS-004]
MGPLRSRADVTELVRWLGRARFDVDDLPARLAVTHRGVGAAPSTESPSVGLVAAVAAIHAPRSI